MELGALQNGDVFGEIAFVQGGQRTATVTAMSDRELLELDERSFHDVVLAYCGRSGEVRRLDRFRMAAHHAQAAAGNS